MKTKFIARSTNRKLGPIPAVYAEKSSCPSSCPLMGAGCYAELGPVSYHWKETKTPWKAFLSEIEAIPAGSLWRYAVAGDLPGKGDNLNLQLTMELALANGESKGFTYTHKPLKLPKEKALIKWVNTHTNFTINLSADSLEECDEKLSWNIAPVVTVVRTGCTLCDSTPKGKTVMVCPETYNPQVNCLTCKICHNSKRDFIVGFPAHGTRKNKINERLENENR
jgi:hypothetical protein